MNKLESEEKVISEIKRNISSADIKKVILGISGGADSVALLRGLLFVGCSIEAVHCNFHLRGEESDRDCRFVKELCERLVVPLQIVDFDTQNYRRQRKISVEMACRELRYDYFEEKRVELGADRIVVAHNADDNVETLLLNLFRGGGIAGLRAMKMDNGRIFRPLLRVNREEILNFLSNINQNYITDSSNSDSRYRRNFLRNEVIPLLETKWPGVKQSISKTASIMGEEEDGINSIVNDLISENKIEYSEIEGKEYGKWLLRKFIKRHGGSDDIVEEMWRSINTGLRIGARWYAGETMFLFASDKIEVVRLERKKENYEISKQFEWQAYSNTPDLLDRIKAEKSNRSLWTSINPEEIVLRVRQTGDRMRPLGMRGSRLVSDMVKESHLTAQEKQQVIVAEDKRTGKIIWVENVRRSDMGLITPEDKIIWELKRRKI